MSSSDLKVVFCSSSELWFMLGLRIFESDCRVLAPFPTPSNSLLEVELPKANFKMEVEENIFERL